jgi:CheY-like chemotaxis protein
MEKMLRRLIGEDVTLSVVAGADLPPIRVDPGQIEQVIMNLVVNARDAMPDGGSVTITTDTVMLDQEFCSMHQGGNAGRYCLISVKDTGTGMNAEVQSRLFEPFFTTKEVGRGTGLGLSTVFGIVRQHGGIVTVESALGKGSTFSVFLPQAEEDRSRHRNALETKLDIHGTETILVVEDDAMVRELAVLVLQLNGYQTLSATLPSEAFALFAEHRNKIALILSDVIMPEMSGQQMYKQMAKDDPTLKVIFMSGYSGETISVHGLIEADAPMISKPFTARALLEKVRIVLDANPCPPK